MPINRAALISPLIGRAEFGDRSATAFMGRRDLYRALGYSQIITPYDHWDRYRRGGIAKRIVEAFPKSTWRGGVEMIEDEDPDTETQFEQAFSDLNDRLRIWATFKRADVLAGLGHYSLILLGAPGNTMEEPLESCAPDDLKYLSALGERDIVIESFNDDRNDERFGMPEFYALRQLSRQFPNTPVMNSRVHWTRIIHVPAEDQLDSVLFGVPRLEPVWNYLDDLMKVVGGGSEAFWKRVDGGKQIKLDPAMPPPTDQQKQELHLMIEEYTHELRRVLTTRGVEIQDLGSNVSQFGPSVQSIIDLISATTGIPQRILMGSERGELASSQDQSNYDDRVEDRRNDYAEPMIVRPFVERLIDLGTLPEPEEFHVWWPEVKNLNVKQRMDLATAATTVNKNQGEVVVTTNEIRDRILGWEAFTPEQEQENIDKAQAKLPPALQQANAAQQDGQTNNAQDGQDGNQPPPFARAAAALENALIDDDFELAQAIVGRALAAIATNDND